MIPTPKSSAEVGRVRFPDRLKTPTTHPGDKMRMVIGLPLTSEKYARISGGGQGRWHICRIARIDFAFVRGPRCDGDGCHCHGRVLGSLFVAAQHRAPVAVPGFVGVRFLRIGIAVSGKACLN